MNGSEIERSHIAATLGSSKRCRASDQLSVSEVRGRKRTPRSGRSSAPTRDTLAEFNKRLNRYLQELIEVDRDDVETLMPLLSDREEHVVRQAYGFAPYGQDERVPRTRNAIGADIGVSGSQVCNIETKAMRRFRHALRTKPEGDDIANHVSAIVRQRIAQQLAREEQSRAAARRAEVSAARRRVTRKLNGLHASFEYCCHQCERLSHQKLAAEKQVLMCATDLHKRQTSRGLARLLSGTRFKLEQAEQMLKSAQAELDEISVKLEAMEQRRAAAEAAWEGFKQEQQSGVDGVNSA